MMRRIHPIAGAAGFVLILAFWTATLGSELFGGPEAIATVKRAIVWGLAGLVPALAVTGATGFRMAGPSPAGPIAAKRKRMPLIAANGLLVLVPCALFLDMKAAAGAFDTAFYAVQGVELVAGAVNLALIALNMRDGLRATGRLARPTAKGA